MPNDPVPAILLPTDEARAKPLPRRLPLAGASPDLVPARMINEALYCERLLYLEWAQGEFADNAFTVEGRVVHKRADQPGGKETRGGIRRRLVRERAPPACRIVR